MAIQIICDTPDKSVVKQCVCRNCGVLLEYTPADTRRDVVKDYTGSSDICIRIDCPKCNHTINV